MKPFIRHCAALLLLSPAVAAWAAADVQSTATISYDFSFSDQASHLDLTSDQSIWSGSTWVAHLGSSDFSVYAPQAEARSYSRSDALQTADSETTLDGNGGTLSAAMTAVSPGTTPASAPFSSAFTTGRIVLAAGATVTLNGHYDISAASTGASAYYGNATAYVLLSPLDPSEGALYNPYEYVSTDPATSFAAAKSGDWSTTYTNTGLSTTTIAFALSAAAQPGNAVSPVPEPQTWALFVSGLVIVGWTARRRAAAKG